MIESLDAHEDGGSDSSVPTPSRIPDKISPDPVEHLAGVEMAVEVRKVLDQLPYKQRAAFLLGRIKGLSYRDVADSLQVSVSAVKSLIFRATSTLRHELHA
jgi:RNA polymerase sigma-70 factor (ECF subfamily)